MDVFRRLKPFYWPHKRWGMLSVFLLIGVTALSLVQPMLLQFLIDDIVIGAVMSGFPTCQSVFCA